MRAFIFAAVALVGCATEPRTPEQQEFLRQWALEQQRHANQVQRDSWNAMRPVAPVQMAAPAAAPLPMNRALATWTGKSELAQSVTGRSGFKCEYYYAGQTFWQMHAGACPSSVWVQ